MKKSFKLQDLECANCAAKMQAAIEKLDGVEAARVNFIMQKFTLTAADERFDEIVSEAGKIMAKIEPDCRIVLS